MSAPKRACSTALDIVVATFAGLQTPDQTAATVASECIGLDHNCLPRPWRFSGGAGCLTFI